MSFRYYLASFKSIWGLLSAVSVTVAALLKFTPLAPPWPDEGGTGATALAVIACIAGISIGYFVTESTRTTRSMIGASAIITAMLFLLAYLYVLSDRTVNVHVSVGGNEVVRRVVVGTVLRHPEDTGRSPHELLLLYGLRGEAWTSASVTQSRISLVALYMGFYLLLTIGLGTLQARSQQQRRAPAA